MTEITGDVFGFAKKLWEEELGGFFSGKDDTPLHGYKLTSDKLKDTIFIEIKSRDKEQNHFTRFYILRHKDTDLFLAQLGKCADSVEVERDGENKSGFYCSIIDAENWKAVTMVILAWAWLRDEVSIEKRGT